MKHALALQPVMPYPPNWHQHRNMWLAVTVTVGLFMAFLTFDSPASNLLLSMATHNPPGGRILAASNTVPLHVTVRVQFGATSWTTTAQPTYGTIPEVLASIANQTRTAFSYDAPGSSIYLHQFLGRGAEPGSRWKISVNGVEVTDLSQVSLAQGDNLLITRS